MISCPSNFLFEHMGIHKKFGGPIQEFIFAIVSIDRKGPLDSPSGLRRSGHHHCASNEAIGQKAGIAITYLARQLIHRKPAIGYLDAAGKAGPIDGALPVGIEAARQESVVPIKGLKKTIGSLPARR
jgi:hypothetical protein